MNTPKTDENPQPPLADAAGSGWTVRKLMGRNICLLCAIGIMVDNGTREHAPLMHLLLFCIVLMVLSIRDLIIPNDRGQARREPKRT